MPKVTWLRSSSTGLNAGVWLQSSQPRSLLCAASEGPAWSWRSTHACVGVFSSRKPSQTDPSSAPSTPRSALDSTYVTLPSCLCLDPRGCSKSANSPEVPIASIKGRMDWGEVGSRAVQSTGCRHTQRLMLRTASHTRRAGTQPCASVYSSLKRKHHLPDRLLSRSK